MRGQAVLIDLVGRRYGRLTIVSRLPNGKGWKPRWLCLCDCGATKECFGTNVTSGKTRSCGCREGGYRHGLSGTPAHNSWRRMMVRCGDPGHIAYADYGGRGIVVC